MTGGQIKQTPNSAQYTDSLNYRSSFSNGVQQPAQSRDLNNLQDFSSSERNIQGSTSQNQQLQHQQTRSYSTNTNTEPRSSQSGQQKNTPMSNKSYYNVGDLDQLMLQNLDILAHPDMAFKKNERDKGQLSLQQMRQNQMNNLQQGNQQQGTSNSGVTGNQNYQQQRNWQENFQQPKQQNKPSYQALPKDIPQQYQQQGNQSTLKPTQSNTKKQIGQSALDLLQSHPVVEDDPFLALSEKRALAINQEGRSPGFPGQAHKTQSAIPIVQPDKLTSQPEPGPITDDFTDLTLLNIQQRGKPTSNNNESNNNNVPAKTQPDSNNTFNAQGAYDLLSSPTADKNNLVYHDVSLLMQQEQQAQQARMQAFDNDSINLDFSGNQSVTLNDHGMGPFSPDVLSPQRSNASEARKVDLRREKSSTEVLSPQSRTKQADNIRGRGTQRNMSRHASSKSNMFSPERNPPETLTPDSDFKWPKICVDIRLPPLKPKAQAQTNLLGAINGTLFAAPSFFDESFQQYPNIASHKLSKSPSGLTDQDGSFKQQKNSQRNFSNSDKLKREDDDQYQFYEPQVNIKMGKVTSFLADEVGGFLWTGHEKGCVALWSVEDSNSAPCKFLGWFTAHRRGAVIAMIITQWGELWTGSSVGSVRMWPNIEESILKITQDQLFKDQEWTFKSRELRRQGERAHTEMRAQSLQALAISNSGQIVWSASPTSLFLWDAYTGAYLGMLLKSTEMQNQQSSAISVQQGIPQQSGRPFEQVETVRRDWDIEEEPKNLQDKLIKVAGGVRVAGMLRKYFQTEKGYQQGDEQSNYDTSYNTNPKNIIVSVLACLDNTMMVCYRNGNIEKYSNFGRLLKSVYIKTPLTTAIVVGSKVWLGTSNGDIIVIDYVNDSLKIVTNFTAHQSTVTDIVNCGHKVATLGFDGSIKLWCANVDDRQADVDAQNMWAQKALKYITIKEVQVLCATWNTGEAKVMATETWNKNIKDWLFLAKRADIVVVSLQEIDMGKVNIAMQTTKDYIGYGAEKQTQLAQGWDDFIYNFLAEQSSRQNDPENKGMFYKVSMRQLAGLLIMVYSRENYRNQIGQVTTYSVRTGVGGVGGNKGSVAVNFSMFRRNFMIITSHFAAHQNALDKRRQDYEAAVKNIKFTGYENESPLENNLLNSSINSRTVAINKNSSITSEDNIQSPSHLTHQSTFVADDQSDRTEMGLFGGLDTDDDAIVQGSSLKNADVVIWLGDFNYRINIDHLDIKDVIQCIEKEQYHDLLKYDQCKEEIRLGNVFKGLAEGPIRFKPTYKFIKGDQQLNQEFSSSYGNVNRYDREKGRTPSWTDRILFRGSQLFSKQEQMMDNPCKSYANLEWREGLKKGREPEEIVATCKDEHYNSCMLVTESDHKPVYSLISLTVPIFNQERKRERLFNIMHTHQKQCSKQQDSSIVIDKNIRNGVKLGNMLQPSTFWLKNQGQAPLYFEFMGEKNGNYYSQNQNVGVSFYEANYVLGRRQYTFFPQGLYVSPQKQIIMPGQQVTVTISQLSSSQVVGMKTKIAIKFGEEHLIGKEVQENSSKVLEINVYREK